MEVDPIFVLPVKIENPGFITLSWHKVFLHYFTRLHIMKYLTTPFTYPKATLYSLCSPLIELRGALIATREGRGTIRI